jgi:NitT/TauT family transport system ATP-binding protein
MQLPAPSEHAALNDRPAREAPDRSGSIAAQGIGIVFRRRRFYQEVLRDVDLTVEAGEFVSLLGPSGCGKSTLLKIIAGLLRPTSGEIEVDGLAAQEALRRRAIGVVFQQPILLPWRTVEANVALLGEVGRRRSRSRVREEGRRALEIVGLADAAHKLPSEISGGMAQRAAIARALTLDPAILLMDEPFGALDAITREQMNASLLEIWSTTHKTVVFVTHSISEALFLSDRIVVMETGGIREVLDVKLPRPRTPETIELPEFRAFERHLRELLVPRAQEGVMP